MTTSVGSELPRHLGEGTRRLGRDRVLAALAAGFAIVAIVDPPQTPASAVFLLGSLAGIAPFLALAVLFAGWTIASDAGALIARAFEGRAAMSVWAGALVGALSPFCSCGVIPVVAALLAGGVPLAPVMAFWLASPVMDPEMFLLTAAGIDLPFAVAKTVAAAAIGALGGFVVLLLAPAGLLEDVLRGAAAGGCSGRAACGPSRVAWAFWRSPERRAAFWRGVRENAWFLGRWLALAFFVESLMLAYVPGEWVAGLLGGASAFAIPLAVGVGVPAYLNGYAAIPLVSGLLSMGMAPGAALAFMTAGAVSSIPAAIAVYALVTRRVFGLYLALGLAGSALAGYGYELAIESFPALAP